LSETRIPDLTEILNNHIERDERIALGDGAVFIAYNDQARVLREIAFKRALIEDLLGGHQHDGSVERRLRLLAAVYEEETDHA